MRHCYAAHLTESNVKWGCPNCEQLWRASVGNWQCILLSLALSTVAFFVSRYFIKRMLDDRGIATRGTRDEWTSSNPLMSSYGVAAVVDFATK